MDYAIERFRSLGYMVGLNVVSASDFLLPQSRRRVWMRGGGAHRDAEAQGHRDLSLKHWLLAQSRRRVWMWAELGAGEGVAAFWSSCIVRMKTRNMFSLS